MSLRAFGSALLDPNQAIPLGLTGPAGSAAGRRYDVYRNNVIVGLTDALRNYFPVLRKLVGDDFFTAMAAAFARAHPPTLPVLFRYGDAMPAFLTDFPPVAHLGYLPDIARLELAVKDAYHAADHQALPADALVAMPPDDLPRTRLHIAAHVHLVRSDWPIHAIWSANTQGTPPPADHFPEVVLVLRPAFDPVVVLLPPATAQFIAALMAGQTLGEAVDHAGPSLTLTAALSLLLTHNAIASVQNGGAL